MWEKTITLKHCKVAQDEDKKLNLVGVGSTLQITIDDDGFGSYIDIDQREAEALIAKIQEWIAAKNA